RVQPARYKCLPEVGLDDVRLRQIASAPAPPTGLSSQRAGPRELEVDVVLVRTPLLPPEDEQPRVDALAPQGVDVSPTGAGDVHGQMQDAGVDEPNDTIRRRARRAETTSVPGCAQCAPSGTRTRTTTHPR